MKTLSDTLRVLNQQNKTVARVVLNGYNIDEGGPLGHEGAMRSFKLVEGDLWQEWAAQAPLLLQSESGHQSKIRVAALPAEPESFGLIEFL